MTTTQYGTAWCQTCRKSQPIMDRYLTDDGLETAGQSPAYLAQPLECGHSAGDGSDRPAVSPSFTPDPTLVDRLVALQDAQRAAQAVGWGQAFIQAPPF